ncbi:hypothetical protein AX17_004164 [Amanita inopinata Kibby_2008]|nr:hypothetical protein AX17_004164 [Amanita inopinata Kibby_2008]
MASIGSVFLGDVQRHRVFSTSTPPNSPPATSLYHGIPSPPPATSSSTKNSAIAEGNEVEHGHQKPAATTASSTDTTKTPTIDPILSLELRLRWLEAIVLGVPQGKSRTALSKNRKTASVAVADGKTSLLKHGETLLRLAKDVQRRLDAVVEANEGLKRFVAHYEQHADLLTPASALSGMLADSRLAAPQAAPEYADMSSEEFDALLHEMEPDIRAADRDMREIEMLEKKGVTGAGKLAEYEALQPRLEAMIKVHQEDLELVASLEKRIADLMKRNATQVDALSELFVAWDDTLTEAEDKITRLEREKAERLRLGLEQDSY